MRTLFILLFFLPIISESSAPLKFVVMSDIHIYASGRIPPKAKKVVEHIVESRPDLVLITGDHTNGNRGDKYSRSRIKKWYQSLDILLGPLFKANIPVIPVVGNHDFYEVKHQVAYKAWSNKVLSNSFKIIQGSFESPLNFYFTHKGHHFLIFNLWRQSMSNSQMDWAKSLKINEEGLRFGFGHVPLYSVMGRTSSGFYQKMTKLFNELEMDIYFSGHEHLHWDEKIDSTMNFRQVIVGTASGTYNFPVKSSRRSAHCYRSSCTMPFTNKQFKIVTRNGKYGYQKYKQNWMEVTVQDNKISSKSFSLDSKGKKVSFYE